MNHPHPTGLGEPIPEGKMALFQPPQCSANPSQEGIETAETPEKEKQAMESPEHTKTPSPQRIRTTIDLTSEALVILQQVQQEHRLRTGRAMPIWKALSKVITSYRNE